MSTRLFGHGSLITNRSKELTWLYRWISVRFKNWKRWKITMNFRWSHSYEFLQWNKFKAVNKILRHNFVGERHCNTTIATITGPIRPQRLDVTKRNKNWRIEKFLFSKCNLALIVKGHDSKLESLNLGRNWGSWKKFLCHGYRSGIQTTWYFHSKIFDFLKLDVGIPFRV